MEGQADPRNAAGDAGDRAARPADQRRPSATAAIDESQTGAVYDAIVKRYGIQGKLFTFVSKLRGGMRALAWEAQRSGQQTG